MKKLIIMLCLLAFGCTPLVKYTPPTPEPVVKMDRYVLPHDPTASLGAPQAIFLKKDADGRWSECPESEAYVTAYTGKEHDKIVLRFNYYKELTPQLVTYINVLVDLGNTRAELRVDERLAKEVYKQMWVDAMNKNITDKQWHSLQKTGDWVMMFAEALIIILLLVK